MKTQQITITSFRDLFHICFKRKGLIFGFFMVTVCTIAIVTFLAEPLYRANAQILVKLGRENIYVPATGIMAPVFRVDRVEKLNSAIEILKSPSLVEKTVRALGPTLIYADLKDVDQNRLKGMIKEIKATIEKLVRRVLPAESRPWISVDKDEKILDTAIRNFTKNLTIEGVEDSNLINISFKHEDPRMAARGVNELTGVYLEHYLKAYKNDQSDDFYQRQVDFLKDKLHQKEEKLNTLKSQHNITSLEEQKHLLLSKAADLRFDLNNTLSSKTEIRKRIDELRSQLNRIPKTIPQAAETGGNPYLINTLETRLVELELEEKKLLTKYTGESRLVNNVRDEMNVVKNKLNAQENKKYERNRSGVNPTYQNLEGVLLSNESELEAIKAKALTQKVQLDNYRKELENLSQIEAMFKRLSQEIELDRKNYQNYLSKFEDSRISKAMDAEKIASINIVEAAKPPREPISPNKKLNMLIALFVGGLGGLALAFIIESFDDSFDKPEDIEDFLQAPVLTSLPELKIKKGAQLA